MDRILRLGYSPCPNDTFNFFALAEGQISTTPYELEISLADVEILPQEAWPYIKRHAQEMTDEVIGQHIETFVNEFSLEVGEEGKRAIRFLLEAAARQQGLSLPQAPLFWDERLEETAKGP